MSFSLETGYSEQRNKKKGWVHKNPLFGTRRDIDQFLKTLGLVTWDEKHVNGDH